MSLQNRWDQTKEALSKSWYPIPATVEAWFARAFLWWVIGALIAMLLANDEAMRAGEAYIAWAGAIYGAIGALVYRTANNYRLKRMLTWAQVIARGLVIVIAWTALNFSLNNWQTIAPILLVIGLFALYVAAGLFILYLAVRVIRVAWKHGGPRQ